MGSMNSKVTLDQAGRVVLPKKLRDELHLSLGDTLDVTVQGDEVKLRPRLEHEGFSAIARSDRRPRENAGSSRDMTSFIPGGPGRVCRCGN